MAAFCELEGELTPIIEPIDIVNFLNMLVWDDGKDSVAELLFIILPAVVERGIIILALSALPLFFIVFLSDALLFSCSVQLRIGN